MANIKNWQLFYLCYANGIELGDFILDFYWIAIGLILEPIVTNKPNQSECAMRLLSRSGPIILFPGVLFYHGLVAAAPHSNSGKSCWWDESCPFVVQPNCICDGVLRLRTFPKPLFCGGKSTG